MPQTKVDLTSLFQAVTQTLQENQQSLDQADTYNQDHGTNMAKTFATITNALEKKKGSSASTALAYAGKMVAKSSTSSSSKLYAENLTRAADQFKGKRVTERGALDLLQTLIGAEQGSQPSQSAVPQPAGGGDILGSLLGGLTGSESTQQPAAPAEGDLLSTLLGGDSSSQGSAGGDLLGSLLGGLTGGQSSSSQQGGGIGLQDLLQAGMAFMQAKQQGQGNLQAIIQAVTAASRVGTSAPYRSQSTQLVVQSFLQALSGTR